ncbi:MAG: LacI family transcriptional regulator [Anaerolineae bacterium]|nr:LacI family transcriptional regulator [Anaerolineae bacterium]NUQ05362.1 LacI family DNA-binding transcriptional regulator [Anaerolineae bacterium]
MATIEDVAKRAGVSAMTVSRVLNNSGYIGAKTREKVERAIEELGYVPNALARSLRFKTTHTLALVLTDITNSYFTTVARGVEDMANARDFTVMFCNTDESPDKEMKYLSVLAQKQVDGVLLVPAFSSPDPILFLKARGIPVVVLDRRIPVIEVDTVRTDSVRGAYQLTRHLLDLGHRRIAILTGPVEISTSTDRVAGYRRALSEAGLSEADAVVMGGAYTISSGYQLAQRALALKPTPTALFAGNNFIAIGALRALRDAGVRVPEEMSVVSFDDLPSTTVVDPFLTVVSQPAYAIGEQATSRLFDVLAGRTPTTSLDLVLPAEMIVRQSSGAPRREDPDTG